MMKPVNEIAENGDEVSEQSQLLFLFPTKLAIDRVKLYWVEFGLSPMR
jgi:hypothetical protein